MIEKKLKQEAQKIEVMEIERKQISTVIYLKDIKKLKKQNFY